MLKKFLFYDYREKINLCVCIFVGEKDKLFILKNHLVINLWVYILGGGQVVYFKKNYLVINLWLYIVGGMDKLFILKKIIQDEYNIIY